MYRGACATDMNQRGPANELCTTLVLHSEWLQLWCVSAAGSEWMICSLDNRRSLPFMMFTEHDLAKCSWFFENTGPSICQHSVQLVNVILRAQMLKLKADSSMNVQVNWK